MKLFLSSYEYNDFSIPREVLYCQKMFFDDRNVLFVKVNEPLIGQKYGLLDAMITDIYLINRVNEDAFDKLDKFPIDVYVLIPKDVAVFKPSSLLDLQNIAWACLYDNKEDARKHRLI